MMKERKTGLAGHFLRDEGKEDWVGRPLPSRKPAAHQHAVRCPRSTTSVLGSGKCVFVQFHIITNILY